MKKIFKVLNKETTGHRAETGTAAKGGETEADNYGSANKQAYGTDASEITSKRKEIEMTAYGELVYQRNSAKDFIPK